jgi:cytochrome c oxidase subunit 2
VLFPAMCVLWMLNMAWSPPAWGNDNRGQALFRLCAACHGPQGTGQQQLGAPAIAGLPEWYVAAQLHKFRHGVRGMHPQDSAGMRMRPMARALPTDSDVQAVARYVAALPPSVQGSTTVGDPASGKVRYQLCAGCHGPDARGMQSLQAPPLMFANDWYLLRQLDNFKQGIRGGDATSDPTGALMRSMTVALDEPAMRDVLAYIRTLR